MPASAFASSPSVSTEPTICGSPSRDPEALEEALVAQLRRR